MLAQTAARGASTHPGRRRRLAALPAGAGRALDDICGGQVAGPSRWTAGRRRVVERTHAWGNQYGKLRWCTEHRRLVVEFWLALVSAVIICGRLLRRAWTCYRRQGRPRRRT
jgi:hypothetical protein